MSNPSKESALREPRVRELLLGYLLHVDGLLWPGADALTLDDLIRAYPQVAALGRVPSGRELQARHPELADLLGAIFDAHQPPPPA